MGVAKLSAQIRGVVTDFRDRRPDTLFEHLL